MVPVRATHHIYTMFFILMHELREKCLYSELFWSAFACIWTVSLRIQSQCGKMRTRISPNTDTFYAVMLHITFLGSKMLESIWTKSRWRLKSCQKIVFEKIKIKMMHVLELNLSQYSLKFVLKSSYGKFWVKFYYQILVIYQ